MCWHLCRALNHVMHVLASLSCIESCANQASFKAVPRFFSSFLHIYAWELSELVLLHHEGYPMASPPQDIPIILF